MYIQKKTGLLLVEVQVIHSCPNKQFVIGEEAVLTSDKIGEPLSVLPFNKDNVLTTNKKQLTDQVSTYKKIFF